MPKIAVIGSGISGMAAAYLLAPGHAVTVYEKNASFGGHTRTKRIDYNGQPIAVDTGFIVFNHVNYPELTGLFRHLGIATKKSPMSFGFSLKDGAFEWGADSLNAVFGQRANLFQPDFYRMLAGMLRFFKDAPQAIEQHRDKTLGQFLDALNVNDMFRRTFIIPMGAAIWSCPAAEMMNFPAATFVTFFKNHGLLSATGQHQWYTVVGGSQAYVDVITKSYAARARLGTKVVRVLPENGKVIVHSEKGDTASFDHVILASHADESLGMLLSATDAQRNLLSAFRFQNNEAWLHHDSAQMPRQRRCWSSWNYLSSGDAGEQLTLTYWMNALQGIDPTCPLFVTLNPAKPIAAGRIFDKHSFTHPVFTKEAITAQKNMPVLQGDKNIWYCGAWQRYGFHEDGLMSAIAVAKALGASVPWH